MFVNQDLLLAEHSGVATVWLLSTLGNKTSYKKISKREIQSVSIPQTCDVIKNPPNPMALRLTSNLLYGVALIYKQKTDYLNNDASLIKTKIQRDLFNQTNSNSRVSMKEPRYIIIPTDLNRSKQGGNSNNNQVLLNDDPLFNIQGDLLPNLDDLDFIDGIKTTQVVNSNQRRDQIRKDDLENNTVSVILSNMTNSTEEEQLFTRNINQDDLLDTQNPEFAFDEEGMLLDLHGDTTNGAGDLVPANDDIDLGFDFDFGGNGEERINTPHPQDIGTPNRETTNRTESTPLDQILEEVEQGGQLESHQESQKSINLPKARTKRKAKGNVAPIIMDEHVTLQTADLRGFRDNYVEIMKSQTKKPKMELPDFREIMNNMSFLPDFAKRSIRGEAPQSQLIDHERRGRSRERQTGVEDDDFVDGLMRNARRSSESIEVARRNSSRSRRESRDSLSSLQLQMGNQSVGIGAGGDQTTENFDLDFDFDFGGVGDEYNKVYPNSEPGSATRKRSSSSITRFPTLREGDENELMNQPIINPSQIDKKTLKFLSFIEARFDEDEVDGMNFEQLMQFETNRSLAVKSFYEVLQLTTLNTIRIHQRKSSNQFELKSAKDFVIKLL